MEKNNKTAEEILLEVKNEVAKKNGFKDWSHIQQTWLDRTNMVCVVHENYVDQTAELYASLQSSKKDERIEHLGEEIKILNEHLTVESNLRKTFSMAVDRQQERIDELEVLSGEDKERIAELEGLLRDLVKAVEFTEVGYKMPITLTNAKKALNL